MLQQIYSSTSCLPGSGEDLERGVTEIISRSFPKNRRRGVTGILLHAGDRFLQLLEGPVAGIEEAMGYIACDSRHRDVEIISKAVIDHYSLPYSPMECAGLGGELPPAIRDALVRDGEFARASDRVDPIRDYLLS